MNRHLFFKIAAIFLLLGLLLIPMVRIHFLVEARQKLRDEVVQDIARSAGYAQTITGPVLVVPYSRTLREWEEARDGSRREVTRVVEGRLHLLPGDFDLKGSLSTEERRRGIYRARLYNAVNTLEATFDVPAFYGVKQDAGDYVFGEPSLAVGISDIRGIGNALTLTSVGFTAVFEPGTTTPVLGEGVHAVLPARDASVASRFEVSIGLQLQGTGMFSITPVGRESRVQIRSDWPHPSFTGEFLPRERTISAQGFDARWQTSFFATNLEEALRRCEMQNAPEEPACKDFNNRSFGVSFVDPVDQYLKTERATKYAFLFIGLTFAAFFLFEVLRRFNVHPVQYGLVGLSLALFFLLLLALSEHIGFTAAYLIAAGACVLLNGFYVSHVLGRANGLAFGASLALLYGLLFGILGSEDYALLMGSLLVFALLGAVMVLTRKVNWSRFGSN
jgi:inner membrane protein